MDSSVLIEGIAANVTGFFAKQYFCYVALEPIRRSVDVIITKIATKQLGFIMATFVSGQLGAMAAFAVTWLLGDLLYFTMAETVHTIIMLARLIIWNKREIPGISIFKELTLRSASYLTYLVSNEVFCHFALKPVEFVTDFCFRKFVTLSSSVLDVGPVKSVLATIVAPQITYLFGEIVGTVMDIATYEALSIRYCRN
jgi:hypothetical protein